MFTNQHRKQLQRLLSDPAWAGFEAFFEDYMTSNFTTPSAKRATEFDTIWYLAGAEGAKEHLNRFVHQLEIEASKVDLS